MTLKKGNLLKMKAEVDNSDVYYFLNINKNIPLNNYIGKELSIRFLNKINCIKCGGETRKSFGQGFCYPCFTSVPETEDCVLRPELCRAHEGIARDMEYAKAHCLIDQVVYLSFTGNIKVGVTRSTQIPTRWIDQGATSAIIVAVTPNRYLAGTIEVALKNIFSDKTNWRKMLSETHSDDDFLINAKGNAEEVLPFELREYISDDDTIHHLNFPVQHYPNKIKSLSLDKTNMYTGVLNGIKGQYLIFDDGIVINIRKHNGFLVEMNFD